LLNFKKSWTKLNKNNKYRDQNWI